jgi:hypothetical protein
MGRNAVQLVVTVIVVTAALIKLAQLAQGRSGMNRPAVAAMWSAIMAMAVAVAQETPTITVLLNGILGTELGYAQRHTAALVSFCFLRIAFLCWVWEPGNHRRRRIRVHAVILGWVLAARWCIAALSPVGEAAKALDGYWSQAPWTTAAMLLYVAYMITTISSVAVLARLWAKAVTARRRWTALGLRMIALGATGYELYLVHKLIFLIVQLSIGRPPYDQVEAEAYLLVPATLLLVVGLAVPLVATGVPAAVNLTRSRIAYGRLGPLWMALTGHRPQVVLSSRPEWLPASLGSWWDRFSLRELGFRLYRRVIECWDVTVALHGHLDSRLREDVYQRARERGVGEDDARAIAEAVMIRTALESARDQEEFVPAHHRAQPMDRHPQLNDNVAWWQAISRAWGHPVTAALSPPLRPLT